MWKERRNQWMAFLRLQCSMRSKQGAPVEGEAAGEGLLGEKGGPLAQVSPQLARRFKWETCFYHCRLPGAHLTQVTKPGVTTYMILF